jgi:hypothetical protein
MTSITVRTQEEVDRAVADGVDEILIRSERGIWITVRACDSATVRACDSATVEAYDSATVEAYDSATVRAYDSATVRACDSATVRAYDSATVRAYDSATVRAAPWVAVHLFSQQVTLSGGHVIDMTALDLTDPTIWCAYHGVDIAEPDGQQVAFLYKAVNAEWTTYRGWDYHPGSLPEAATWEPDGQCGAGLHFSPRPAQAQGYLGEPAAHFLRVGVRLDEMSPISSDKAKARRVVVPCVEVDINGNEITK